MESCSAPALTGSRLYGVLKQSSPQTTAPIGRQYSQSEYLPQRQLLTNYLVHGDAAKARQPEATGKVRFEGMTGAFIQEGDAEIRIDATAVPPLNLSGGPNQWPGETVEWSASWFGEVDSSGAFSMAIQAPDLEAELPSNTRMSYAYLCRTYL